MCKRTFITWSRWNEHIIKNYKLKKKENYSKNKIPICNITIAYLIDNEYIQNKLNILNKLHII